MKTMQHTITSREKRRTAETPVRRSGCSHSRGYGPRGGVFDGGDRDVPAVSIRSVTVAAFLAVVSCFGRGAEAVSVGGVHACSVFDDNTIKVLIIHVMMMRMLWALLIYRSPSVLFVHSYCCSLYGIITSEVWHGVNLKIDLMSLLYISIQFCPVGLLTTILTYTVETPQTWDDHLLLLSVYTSCFQLASSPRPPLLTCYMYVQQCIICIFTE